MGKEIHLLVAFLSLLANLALLIPFYLKRHHYLINYNGFKLNFSICVLTAFTMVFNALFSYFGLPCIFNAALVSFGISIPLSLQCVKYLSYIIINEATALKIQLLSMENKKMNSNDRTGEDLNQNFLNMNCNINSQSKKDMNIEKNYNKKYMKPVLYMYGFFFISSFTMSFVLNRDILWSKCGEPTWKFFIPIMAVSFISTMFIPYFLIYTFKKFSFDRKLDLIVFVAMPSIGATGYILSKVGVFKVEESSYFFYIAYYTTLVTTLGIPLLNVYKVKNRTVKKSNKEDFIRLLFDKNFFILLKKQSIQLYCVENTLFWEMHRMLMTVVFTHYSASNSEKRKNRMIKKNATLKMNNSVTDSCYLKVSTDNLNSVDNEDIDIVVDKNDVCDSQSINKSNISLDTRDSNFTSNIHNHDAGIINFVNEKNIVFYDDGSADLDSHTTPKSDAIYNILFKEYCASNNIRLTDKEYTIESFLIDDNLSKYYRKLYDIFIDPDGMSPLNIPNNVLEEIKHQLDQPTFSHKIFKPVVTEVVDMLYQNVYMNTLKNMN